MANKHKNKGSGFERELASYFANKTGLRVHRTLGTNIDNSSSDLHGSRDLQGLPNLAVEAKRVEKLNFPEAMRQAIDNAGDSGDIPIVINRRNHQKTEDAFVLMTLKDFMRLYKAFIEPRQLPF